MNTLILFTSRTGASEQYAQWIQKEIGDSSTQNIKINSEVDFNTFDRVIFVLPTYEGKINKKEFLEHNWDKIKSKLIYLVVVGGVPQESSWSKRSYNAINQEVREGLKGYVKIIGLAENPDKKMGKLERFMGKLFLGMDPEQIEKRKEVFEEDLEPVWKMLKL